MTYPSFLVIVYYSATNKCRRIVHTRDITLFILIKLKGASMNYLHHFSIIDLRRGAYTVYLYAISTSIGNIIITVVQESSL